MEAVIEDNKEGYYRALRQTQTTLNSEKTDFELWLEFFLKTLQKQKIRLEYKINNEETQSTNRSDYTELEEKILSYFESDSNGTTAKIVKYTKANRNTIKKALQNLVTKNILTLHSKGRGAWYSKK